MTFEEYEKLAMETAIYPNIGGNIYYPMFGLINEFGELLQTNENETAIMQEIGDILWYINCCNYEFKPFHINIRLEHLYSDFRNKKINYDPKQVLTYIGNICGVFKKVMRDDQNTIQQNKIDILYINYCFLVEQILTYCFINIMPDNIGLLISKIMQMNIDKLFDRKKRNKIKGDGDNR